MFFSIYFPRGAGFAISSHAGPPIAAVVAASGKSLSQILTTVVDAGLGCWLDGVGELMLFGGEPAIDIVWSCDLLGNTISSLAGHPMADMVEGHCPIS